MNEMVSIICTVKNGEYTLPSTINSVLNQTYSNYEFIIVDDGSTDSTKKILEKYKKQDDRIKVHYSGGIGRAPALNKAVELSQGKYITNIDADDVMHPQKLEIQLKVLSNYEDYFLISTKSLLFYEEDEPDWEKITTNSNIEVKEVNKKLLIRNGISHSTVMMNKKILLKLGGYDTSRKSQVDYELWLRAFLKDYKMGVIDYELIGKRIHINQSFENKNRLKYTFNSMQLQLNYILREKNHLYLLPIPVLTFITAQLPFSFRRILSKFIFNK